MVESDGAGSGFGSMVMLGPIWACPFASRCVMKPFSCVGGLPFPCGLREGWLFTDGECSTQSTNPW